MLQVVIDVIVESFPSVLRNLNDSIQLHGVLGVIPRVFLLQLNKGDKDTTGCQYGEEDCQPNWHGDITFRRKPVRFLRLSGRRHGMTGRVLG